MDGASARSQRRRKSSAVSGASSLQRSLLRRWKVQTRPPSLTSHDSARSGSTPRPEKRVSPAFSSCATFSDGQVGDLRRVERRSAAAAGRAEAPLRRAEARARTSRRSRPARERRREALADELSPYVVEELVGQPLVHAHERVVARREGGTAAGVRPDQRRVDHAALARDDRPAGDDVVAWRQLRVDPVALGGWRPRSRSPGPIPVPRKSQRTRS